ncbi:MAG TPA: hypothetical protein PKA13_02550 [Geminicoccaceae bacterium]|nr:hypothetical protein [Geminicoccus sp.]HMU48625.1 hypothetical protein [Geminicoccaceae bacterium]
MPHYHVWSIEDSYRESYWVLADSEEQARRLVALNVDGDAATATDPKRYRCTLSDERNPPFGVIYRGMGGTFTIERR